MSMGSITYKIYKTIITATEHNSSAICDITIRIHILSLVKSKRDSNNFRFREAHSQVTVIIFNEFNSEILVGNHE